MIAYKLMNQDFTTHKGFKWEIGKKETIDIRGNELCSDQVFHAYKSPELAVIFNPIHAEYKNPLLVKIECDIVADDGLKIGSKWQTPLELVTLPNITQREKIVFAILCAKSVSHLLLNPIEAWDKWSNDYLNNKVISKEDCASYIYYVCDNNHRSYAAAVRAARAAVRAADTVRAIRAADAAARAADAAYTARTAVRAARAAVSAADAIRAARAARAAYTADKTNFIEIYNDVSNYI